MENDLSNYRKSYQKKGLSKSDFSENPLELFQKWFYEVEEFGGNTEVNAMTLSTIGLDGGPKSRIVLLKKFTWEGFIFFTNYLSDKGRSIAENPNVCLSFFWENMERQVIIQGQAEKISENLSDGYFESRPEGSKLSAWVSEQSAQVPNRSFLDEKLSTLKAKFKNKEIPRPEHWGGYLVKPIRMEFWQGQPDRLHDRICCTLQENFEWKIERLAP
jgi:pyridoxamine 5'-phosphate oxidase